jgi:hypothetical protein
MKFAQIVGSVVSLFVAEHALDSQMIRYSSSVLFGMQAVAVLLPR